MTGRAFPAAPSTLRWCDAPVPVVGGRQRRSSRVDGIVRRLTSNSLTDVFPAVSRDGKHIALTRDIAGYAQVFVMDVHGRHVRKLTHTHANSGLPAWSPDGRQIAFATDRNAPDDGDEIYVMNSDGTGQRAVTRNLPSA